MKENLIGWITYMCSRRTLVTDDGDISLSIEGNLKKKKLLQGFWNFKLGNYASN